MKPDVVGLSSPIESIEKYLIYYYVEYNIDRKSSARLKINYAISLLTKLNSTLVINGLGWGKHCIFSKNFTSTVEDTIVGMYNLKVNVDELYLLSPDITFDKIEDLSNTLEHMKTPTYDEQVVREEIKEEVKKQKTNTSDSEEVKEIKSNKGDKMKKFLKYSAIVAVSGAVAVASFVAYNKYK